MAEQVEQNDRSRTVVIAVVVVLALIVGYLLLSGGSSYTLHARYVDASQVVKGDLVEVGGQTVGVVSSVDVTNNNQADVTFKIKDKDFRPLHRGTTAIVRSVGLSGVANRFLEITPGPLSAPKIPDGGLLTTSETAPIVDLDSLLTSFDPTTRRRLQSIFHDGTKLYGGTAGALRANHALAYLNPAVAQSRALTDEIVRDQGQFERLITSSAKVVTALASRSSDIEQGVSNTATTLGAIAQERTSLQDALGRAPTVLHQAQGTLRTVRSTLATVNPVLKALQPSARPLAEVLRKLPPTARRASPVLAELTTLLKPLRVAVAGLPALTKVAVPALVAAKDGVAAVRPIAVGLEPYAPDLVAGFFNGFTGSTGTSYDANGHYARVSPTISAAQGVVGVNGLLPSIPAGLLTSITRGVNGRCPGSAEAPAADGSNPFNPFPGDCDPKAVVP